MGRGVFMNSWQPDWSGGNLIHCETGESVIGGRGQEMSQGRFVAKKMNKWMKHSDASVVSGLMSLHWLRLCLVTAVVASLAGCGSKPDEPAGPVRGEAIPAVSNSPVSGSASNVYPDLKLLFAKPDVVEDGFIRLWRNRSDDALRVMSPNQEVLSEAFFACIG